MKRELFDTIKLSPYTSGTAIDRQGFLSAVLAAKITAVTGSPTAAKVTVAVTHSDTSGGTYKAVTDERLLPDGGEFDISVANGLDVNIPVDLLGCKRYVKFTATVSYTGGTTPGSTNAYALALGDPANAPV
jgi:hypothetical protein